ncbi:MAG: T9SS type A sorting domain-containing protein [Bacteroidales bacterium]|jgi:hypothetical protein|nr:T9SS type A sorting domain-containing protein [Bacteroidales bacterium]
MRKELILILCLILQELAVTKLSGQLSSNLPIVVITTPGGAEIPDEPKIIADMKIISNGTNMRNSEGDPGNVYSGIIAIETKGQYSGILPQKPFLLETRDASGNNLNVPILGMPEENDWVLTANYNDKAFLRNFLSFEIFRKMGHYAPRTVYCEVVVNGEYLGIYLMGEKIKQDKNRVDISKLKPDESVGDDLSGGYIFANDYYDNTNSWKSNFSPVNKPGAEVYFVYIDPKPTELTQIQKTYLKNFVDSFEQTLYSSSFTNPASGYRAYLDVNSFIDYFILQELSRNVDGYKKSRYYYKDKDSKGGKINSGPPWDFDWAYKDVLEGCIHTDPTDGSGWAYRINECDVSPVPPSWEVRLLEDENYANRIHERYFQLRKTYLSETYLHHVIDSVAYLLDEAQQRHYDKWPILGINVGTAESGEQPLTYAGEIEKFKNWIHRRLTWLDENMVGQATTSGGEIKPVIFRIFPNPASESLYVESEETISRVNIFSLTGNLIHSISDTGDYRVTVDVSNMPSGLYIISVTSSSGNIFSSKFLKK